MIEKMKEKKLNIAAAIKFIIGAMINFYKCTYSHHTTTTIAQQYRTNDIDEIWMEEGHDLA
jgi:hypothetical protein